MKLQRIFLRRVPGIDPPFSLDDLAPGVNVIVGPNGSGKTSICRAVAATLWPRSSRYESAEIETFWNDGGRVLRADVNGKRVSWQLEGDEAEAPSLPDEHLAPCYTLSIRDLLEENMETDLDIARQIRIQMSGGYDLQALLEKRFRIPSRAGAKERQDLEEAEKRYAAERKDLRDLARDEDRLYALRAGQARARKAYHEVQALESAIELADVRVALSAVHEKLDSLPEELERFTGEEIERLGELEHDLAEAMEGERRCGERISEARAAVESSRIKVAADDDATVEAWRVRTRKLPDMERQSRVAATAAAKAQEKLGEARRALGVQADSDIEGVPCVDLPALSDLEEFLQTRSDVHARRTALDERLKSLDDGSDGEDASTLARGLDALRDWLAAPGPRDRNRVPAWVVIMALLATGLGVIFALGSSPWWSLVTGAGLGVLLLAALFHLFGGDEVTREREVHLQRWWGLKLGDPPSWSPEDVRKHAHLLEERLARAQVQNERKVYREELRRQLQDLDLRDRELERDRAQLGQRLGLELPSSDLALLEWARRIQVYRESLSEWHSTEAERKDLEGSYERSLGEADGFFMLQGYPSSKDAVTAVAVAEDFRSRREAFLRGLEERERAETESGVYVGKMRQLERRIGHLYQERGLVQGDRGGLDRCLQQWPEYKELRVEERRFAGRVIELEHKLAARSEYLSLSVEEASEKKEKAESSAQSYEDATNEIGDIQGRVSEARGSRRMENAAAAGEAAREALRDARDRALLTAAGEFLIEEVDREHERQSRPEVLRRAMSWFQAFTRDRYELRLTDGPRSTFRAWDTSKAKGLALSELSDATRIQLLLAVRLAFATHAERGVQIPLFLDEALSTADPERFRAVAESLMVLACEGRQVFYLTSNPADAAVWAKIPDDASGGFVSPKFVDLADARGLQSAVLDPARLETPPTRVVPLPEGRSAEQYGVDLGVRLLDPYGPVEAVHLFYLLRRDLGLLHRVLSATRVETVGQWNSLVSSGRAESLLSSTVVRRIGNVVECARAIFEGWSIGRGTPVDKAVLEASGAVSTTFLDRLGELAEEIDGDGERLLVAIRDGLDLRVKRFRADAVDRLAGYLEGHGFIDARRPLEEVELEARVVQAMADTIAVGGLTHAEVCRQVQEFVALFERCTAGSQVAA